MLESEEGVGVGRQVVVRLFLDRRLLPCLVPERSGDFLGRGSLDSPRDQTRAGPQWRTELGLRILDRNGVRSGLDLRCERRLIQGVDQQTFGGLLRARDVLEVGGLVIGLCDGFDLDWIGVDQLGIDRLGVDRLGVDQLGLDRVGVDGLGHIGIGIDPLGPR